MSEPYRTTPVFDENTLPAALRAQHNLKAGVWGRIHVLEGRLKLTFTEPFSEQIVTPEAPALMLPEQPHFVEPLGPIRMQIAFYDHLPDG